MDKNYQYNFSTKNELMFDNSIRLSKANKTLSVLKDYLGNLDDLTLLDIGCSSGIMTFEYSQHFKNVVGVDLDSNAIQYAKEHKSKDNITYINKPIEEIEIERNSIDVITCSHIYEHVPSPRILLDRIYELLKPGGVCYFAAGNRFQIMEAHYRLPFLSFFPKKISNNYIKLFRDEEEYYENLFSHRSLKKLVKNFEINDYTLEVIRKPSKFSANDLLSENTIKYYIVNFLAKLFYFVIPTYIWILKKP